MFCLEKYQILPGRVKHIMYQTMRDMKCRELPVWYWAGRQYCTVRGRDLFLIEVVVAIVILNQVFCTLHCYYICWSYINWEAPQENQVTSSPASQTRPVSQPLYPASSTPSSGPPPASLAPTRVMLLLLKQLPPLTPHISSPGGG